LGDACPMKWLKKDVAFFLKIYYFNGHKFEMDVLGVRQASFCGNFSIASLRLILPFSEKEKI